MNSADHRKTAEEALDDLCAVLCDPEGKACIRGSDGDLRIIDAALATLRAELAVAKANWEGAAETCSRLHKELAAAKAELELRRKSGSAIDRLHNICEGIAESADGSEWSREEWERIEAENDRLRAELAAAKSAIDARAAAIIREFAEQEPVAVVKRLFGGKIITTISDTFDLDEGQLLYAAPIAAAPAVPEVPRLTEEEIRELRLGAIGKNSGELYGGLFARAIESAVRERCGVKS